MSVPLGCPALSCKGTQAPINWRVHSRSPWCERWELMCLCKNKGGNGLALLYSCTCTHTHTHSHLVPHPVGERVPEVGDAAPSPSHGAAAPPNQWACGPCAVAHHSPARQSPDHKSCSVLLPGGPLTVGSKPWSLLGWCGVCRISFPPWMPMMSAPPFRSPQDPLL